MRVGLGPTRGVVAEPGIDKVEQIFTAIIQQLNNIMELLKLYNTILRGIIIQ